MPQGSWAKQVLKNKENLEVEVLNIEEKGNETLVIFTLILNGRVSSLNARIVNNKVDYARVDTELAETYSSDYDDNVRKLAQYVAEKTEQC